MEDKWDASAVVKEYCTALRYPGYPSVIANRSAEAGMPFSGIQQMFAKITTEVGIALDVKLENGKVVAQTKVRRKPTYKEDIRLAVALYENDLHADQNNAVFPEKGNPIKNLRYDHVLRDFYNTAPMGFDITLANDTHKGSYTFTPKADWNTANLGVVVIVLAKNRRVLNSQYANIGESKGY